MKHNNNARRDGGRFLEIPLKAKQSFKRKTPARVGWRFFVVWGLYQLGY